MFTQDEISRRAYEKAEKFRRDQQAQLTFAETKGRHEGILQGQAELARKLIAMGVSAETIMKATGFSREQLDTIKN